MCISVAYSGRRSAFSPLFNSEILYVLNCSQLVVTVYHMHNFSKYSLKRNYILLEQIYDEGMDKLILIFN